MTHNPYSAPVKEAVAVTLPAGAPEAPERATVKRVFLAWERLRIVYNGLLVALTAMLAVPGVIANGDQIFTIRGIVMLIEGAVVANICYFAGPVVEAYARWLGYGGIWMRWGLFIGGTMLTALLALLSILNHMV